MSSSHVAASVFNAQRSSKSDRWFTFLDFHPDHAESSKGLGGNEVNSRVTEQLEASGTVEWLKGQHE